MARARQFWNNSNFCGCQQHSLPRIFYHSPRISLNPCGSERAFSIHDSPMKFRGAALSALFAMKFFQCGVDSLSWMSYVFSQTCWVVTFQMFFEFEWFGAINVISVANNTWCCPVCWFCCKHYRKVFLLQFLECGAIKIAITMYERHHVHAEMWGEVGIWSFSIQDLPSSMWGAVSGSFFSWRPSSEVNTVHICDALQKLGRVKCVSHTPECSVCMYLFKTCTTLLRHSEQENSLSVSFLDASTVFGRVWP